jgi:MFS family permease
VQPEPAAADRAEAEFLAEARGNLRRNYAAHLLHGLFGQTGFRLINAPTFIPSYVQLLAGSEIYVGLARGLQALAQSTTPLASATMIEHRPRVLRMGLLIGGLMRLQVLGIALAGFFIPMPFTLWATLLLLALFGALMGMQGVVFGFLMSKVIPVDVRGRLQGLRNFLAGITAAAVALVGGYLVDQNTLGNGYASTFLLAFVLTALGLCMLLFMREPASPSVREAAGFRGRLADLPALLARDREFTAYFMIRALATLGRMATPYYVLYAATLMTVGGRELGIFTAAWQLAMTTTNLIWGFMADRTGFRAVFLISMVIWTGSVVLLMWTSSFVGITAVFMGIGAGMGGFQMSSQNMVLEFGSRENLPVRIALANTASELTAAGALVCGGFLAASFSYSLVFWLAITSQAAAVVLMLLLVREPRFRP